MPKDLINIINSSKEKINKKFKNLMFLTLASSMLYFGCKKSEDNPITQETNTNIVSLNNTSKGKTDNNGKIIFKEDNQNVIISVIDQQNNPVAGVDVVYVDGQGYEAFIATDENENYLPSFNNFEHNSEHVIKLIPSSQTYSKKTFSSNSSKSSLEGFIKNEIMKDQNGCNSPVYYLGTITGDQYYDEFKLRKGLVSIVSNLLNLPYNVLESWFETNTRLGEILGFDAEVYIRSHNWDKYILVPDNRNNLITTTLYVDVESNPPAGSEPNLTVNNDDVTFSWQGSDKLDYGTITKFKDLTVCKGLTTGPDLKYEPRIFYGTGGLYKRWNTTNITETIYDVPDGDYKFEVVVYDEVGNGEISVRKNFSVSSTTRQDTLTLQPGPEGIDAYVDGVIWAGTSSPTGNTNRGSWPWLYVEGFYSSGDNYYLSRSYLQFDLSSLPNRNIESAKLFLFQNSGGNTIELRRVLSQWEESTIIWDNQPSFSYDNEVSTQTSGSGWYEFNITNLVKNWKSNIYNNHGVILKLAQESGHQGSNAFFSSDTPIANSHRRPKLEVVYR